VKLVLGIDANVESLRHDFWQRVAFYNYVQVKVGTDARERPSPEMWAAAKPLFQNLLASFKPDCVLVLGKAAWSNMPDPDKASNAPHEIKEYRGSFGQIVATYTHHPSSPRFTYAPFRARIAHLLVEGKMLAEKRMANGHLDCVN
jgi:uracil-DNA glycosylase